MLLKKIVTELQKKLEEFLEA